MAEKTEEIKVILRSVDDPTGRQKFLEETSKAIKKVRDQAEAPTGIKGLKGLLGEDSAVGNIGKILAGTGAVAGVFAAVTAVGNVAEGMKGIRDLQREGIKDSDVLAEKYVELVPVLGSLYKSFADIGRAVLGIPDPLQRAKDEAKLLKDANDGAAASAVRAGEAWQAAAASLAKARGDASLIEGSRFATKGDAARLEIERRSGEATTDVQRRFLAAQAEASAARSKPVQEASDKLSRGEIGVTAYDRVYDQADAGYREAMKQARATREAEYATIVQNEANDKRKLELQADEEAYKDQQDREQKAAESFRKLAADLDQETFDARQALLRSQGDAYKADAEKIARDLEQTSKKLTDEELNILSNPQLGEARTRIMLANIAGRRAAAGDTADAGVVGAGANEKARRDEITSRTDEEGKKFAKKLNSLAYGGLSTLAGNVFDAYSAERDRTKITGGPTYQTTSATDGRGMTGVGISLDADARASQFDLARQALEVQKKQEKELKELNIRLKRFQDMLAKVGAA